MGTTYSEDAISGTRETIDIDWERLEEALRKLEEKPAGSFTVRDYAEKYDVTYSSAKNTLGNLVDAGILGRTEPLPGKRAHFWFKENE